MSFETIPPDTVVDARPLPSAPPVARSGVTRGRVVVVDDDPQLRRVLQRALVKDGYEVLVAQDGHAALAWLDQASAIDALVSDLWMPAMDGLELLRSVHARDADLPFILCTAAPDVATAIRAIDLGAYKYLTKPIDLDALRSSVHRAVGLRRLARLKREALALLGKATSAASDRASLDVTFEQAMRSLWVAYQPIVRSRDRSIFGYEALLRSDSTALPTPGAILDAAERLGRLPDLGRAIRASAVPPMHQAPGATLFLNLHPRDLLDDSLMDASSPLCALAPRVVLEITERASLDDVHDARDRIGRLRRLGFRLAIDDLGAGYAGLSAFAAIEPDIVKLDMSLVREIDRSHVKRTVVDSMTSLAHELGVLVVAEGVETATERDVLAEIGCDLMQGYFFARPGRAFPAVKGAEPAGASRPAPAPT